MGASEVTAAYIDRMNVSTIRILTKPNSEVEAGVAAGTYVRVKGCVNAATNEHTLSVGGRHKILNYGNLLTMSTGDGKEYRSDCVRLFPTAYRLSEDVEPLVCDNGASWAWK